jgi:hypothetical protein
MGVYSMSELISDILKPIDELHEWSRVVLGVLEEDSEDVYREMYCEQDDNR